MDAEGPPDRPEDVVRGDGRLSSSFRYAWAGLRHVFRSQRNARIHLGISIIVLAVGIWLGLNAIEWAIIGVMIGVVLMAEMFNTVMETIVDLTTERYHPLAKRAKDVAAGAVLTVAIVAVAVGLLVLGPHFLSIFR